MGKYIGDCVISTCEYVDKNEKYQPEFCEVEMSKSSLEGASMRLQEIQCQDEVDICWEGKHDNSVMNMIDREHYKAAVAFCLHHFDEFIRWYGKGVADKFEIKKWNVTDNSLCLLDKGWKKND